MYVHNHKRPGCCKEDSAPHCHLLAATLVDDALSDGNQGDKDSVHGKEDVVWVHGVGTSRVPVFVLCLHSLVVIHALWKKAVQDHSSCKR